MSLQGKDISEWQGQPNWDEIKAQFDFAIIRSSFGTARADNSFAYNRDNARRVNILRGFYHYAYPEYNSAQAEADFFASVVGQLQPGEVVALDFEENYADPVGWSLAFLQEAEARFGVKPLLYINQALHNAHDWSPVASSDFGLWAADWGASPSAAPWPVVAFWQDSNAAAGGGDHDQFLGDAGALEKYGYSGGGTATGTGVSQAAPQPPAAPAPSPAPAPDRASVTVVSGDSLSAIAARHNVSLADLEAANPQISNFNLIYPGETVNLPGGGSQSVPSASRVYHVVSGDTLSGIAARFGESLADVEAKNPQISNFNLIFPGEAVNI